MINTYCSWFLLLFFSGHLSNNWTMLSLSVRILHWRQCDILQWLPLKNKLCRFLLQAYHRHDINYLLLYNQDKVFIFDNNFSEEILLMEFSKLTLCGVWFIYIQEAQIVGLFCDWRHWHEQMMKEDIEEILIHSLRTFNFISFSLEDCLANFEI